MKVYRKGGRPGSLKKVRKKGKRSVDQDKLDRIEGDANAPLERLFRTWGMNKKYKDVDDNPDGGEGQMICTKDGCEQGGADAEKSAELNDPKNQPKDPFFLRLANWMNMRKGKRAENLADDLSDINKRKHFGREMDINPDRQRAFYIRNPFARAKYRRKQRRYARTSGRQIAGNQPFDGSNS